MDEKMQDFLVTYREWDGISWSFFVRASTIQQAHKQAHQQLGDLVQIQDVRVYHD